jgi:hypothetical protein
MESSEKLVSDVELLGEIFTEEARPSERWLRYQRARKLIPFYRISPGVIRYSVSEVRAALKTRMRVDAKAA